MTTPDSRMNESLGPYAHEMQGDLDALGGDVVKVRGDIGAATQRVLGAGGTNRPLFKEKKPAADAVDKRVADQAAAMQQILSDHTGLTRIKVVGTKKGVRRFLVVKTRPGRCCFAIEHIVEDDGSVMYEPGVYNDDETPFPGNASHPPEEIPFMSCGRSYSKISEAIKACYRDPCWNMKL